MLAKSLLLKMNGNALLTVRSIWALGILAAVLAGQQVGAQTNATRHPRLPDGARSFLDLEYVTNGHPRQKLDLFLPPQGAHWPLIVWIHGGAWRGGSKENSPALPFLRQGYAVASVNYRLSQHAIFPAQILDCKASIRWLRSHAQRFGYDADRIGVWGSSAGGHLVALLGTSAGVKEFDTFGALTNVSSRVQCVVDFFGPTDLTSMARQAPPDSRIDHDAPDSPESHLLGGPVQERKDLARMANPITYITPDDPPFLILHGDKDNLVPIGQSEMLHEALKKSGVHATYHVVSGAGHGFGRRSDVDKWVADFFARHLRPADR
ncbi:MAG: alpha/beta hydrolase [Verrucomicrobiota bacterium]